MIGRTRKPGRRLLAKRRYGWRDIAAVLGVYALVLQLGLGIVAGLAGESIAREQQAAGDETSALALQICSPAGLILLASDDDGDHDARRGAPVCPGCLFAHAGPIPPQTTVADLPEPAPLAPMPPVSGGDIPAPLERITDLNPRAPPLLSA
ncbi:DUF2946 family protein [Thalassobaculum salexigens]|uniref:DUF2946 family protein n=1 Tax=Thalassobaculum salexigens TaxID=455360 RepID=UPI0003FD1686|nr:DUF2946 family protein [Thalassobaculum salexigens]